MRVGFSIVAGAVVSVLMCFGFVAAHLERMTDEMFRWQLSDTDHQALVTIGNHSVDPGTACNRQPGVPCADAADLASVTANFDEAGVDWFISGPVIVKEVSAPGAQDSLANSTVEIGPFVHSIMVYARSDSEAPVVAGRAPRTAHEIALNANLATMLGVGVGDTVQIEDRQSANTPAALPFIVTGLTAVPSTFLPFSLDADSEVFVGSPFALVSPDALPAIVGEHDVAAVGFIHWNGEPELVTSVIADATVEEGDVRLPDHAYDAGRWMALAIALAAAGIAWWALVARGRGRRAWRDGALLILIPAATGIVAVTVAAIAHAAWVRHIAPYTFLPKPLPLPMPWTITALAAGLAVAAVGAAWREKRLQHHEVVDVDELVGEVIA